MNGFFLFMGYWSQREYGCDVHRCTKCVHRSQCLWTSVMMKMTDDSKIRHKIDPALYEPLVAKCFVLYRYYEPFPDIRKCHGSKHKFISDLEETGLNHMYGQVPSWAALDDFIQPQSKHLVQNFTWHCLAIDHDPWAILLTECSVWGTTLKYLYWQ